MNLYIFPLSQLHRERVERRGERERENKILLKFDIIFSPSNLLITVNDAFKKFKQFFFLYTFRYFQEACQATVDLSSVKASNINFLQMKFSTMNKLIRSLFLFIYFSFFLKHFYWWREDKLLFVFPFFFETMSCKNYTLFFISGKIRCNFVARFVGVVRLSCFDYSSSEYHTQSQYS